MLNHIVIMGRLTKDPELRTTQSGVSVTSFTLAVDRDFKNKDSGEKSTDFIDVVAWRATGEFVSRYFTKDRDGNNRRSAEIVADNVYFGDSKRDNGGSDYGSPPPYGMPAASYGAGGSSAPGGYAPPGGGESEGFSDMDDDDGDLPF